MLTITHEKLRKKWQYINNLYDFNHESLNFKVSLRMQFYPQQTFKLSIHIYLQFQEETFQHIQIFSQRQSILLKSPTNSTLSFLRNEQTSKAKDILQHSYSHSYFVERSFVRFSDEHHYLKTQNLNETMRREGARIYGMINKTWDNNKSVCFVINIKVVGSVEVLLGIVPVLGGCELKALGVEILW